MSTANTHLDPASFAIGQPTLAPSANPAPPTAQQFREQAIQAITQSRQVAEDLAAITELVAKIQSAACSQSACQQLANELADLFAGMTPQSDAGQPPAPDPITHDVFVALADDQARLELVAISHTHSIPDDSPENQQVESAIRECVTRNQPTAWPPHPDDRHAVLCHRQLADSIANKNIFSITLNNPQGDLEGVLLVTSPAPLKRRQRSLVGALRTPIGASLSLHKRSRQNRWQRALTFLGQSFHHHRTQSILMAIAAVAVLSLIPAPYRVSSPCEVQPSTKHFIAAPFDAQLEQCLVEPGDIVSKNQVIAYLDGREINLELAQVSADLHRAMKLKDGHVAAHESGQAYVAAFEAEKLRARHRLLSYRSSHLESRSPVDGVVISGDLKQSEGAPLEVGQTLFEIAPLDTMVIEVAIPEDDVRYVHQGMKVRVRLDAFPFENWHGTIERVHPASEIRDHDNVFIATVHIDNHSGRLRPGMQGYAKTSTAWRPIAWNLMHKPVAKALRWLQW